MPKYFIDVAGEELPWPDVELPDREAAREYAIGLAETILRGKDQSAERRSLIVIRDDQGEMLDEVRSSEV